MAETLAWIDVAGNVYSLSDYTFQTYFAEGPLPPVGIYGSLITIISHDIPLQPGVREQWIHFAANDIRFPLRIFGPNLAAQDANRRTLSEAMRPTRGQGILQHTADDGTVRQLFCRETSRLRDVVDRGPGSVKVGLIFSAADPFWYDVDWSTLTFTPSGVVTFFQTPVFPLHISTGGLSSAFTVENLGQDVAWPVWQIIGPGTNPVLTNLTTGQTLALTITLTLGQTLTVDTRPTFVNVTREDGSNQWASVGDTSALWPLIVGSNAVTLSMSGTSSASALLLQYKQRYEGV